MRKISEFAKATDTPGGILKGRWGDRTLNQNFTIRVRFQMLKVFTVSGK